MRRLDDVERRLQDVLGRQREAKIRTLEAQDAMRQMLTAFIGHLSMMNQSSTDFQFHLEESERQMADVRTIEDLTPLLKRVIDATRSMVEDTARARDELDDLQARVLQTDAELSRLYNELAARERFGSPRSPDRRTQSPRARRGAGARDRQRSPQEAATVSVAARRRQLQADQ
jgi:hypothetical protein